MSPVYSGHRARIMLKIEELAMRLGSMERQLTSAAPESRPVIEVGMIAIRHELSNLSRRLR